MDYIKKCTRCKTKLKFPLDKGKLYIHCPNCGEEFLMDPDDKATYIDGSFSMNNASKSRQQFFKKISNKFNSFKNKLNLNLNKAGSRKKINLSPPAITKLWNTMKRKFLEPVMNKVLKFQSKTKYSSVKNFLYPLQIIGLFILSFLLINLFTKMFCAQKVYIRQPIFEKNKLEKKKNFNLKKNLSPEI